MKKVYSIDRFEGDFAVLVCDDETVLSVSKGIFYDLDLREGDVFSARESKGALEDISPMPEERDKRKAEARRRLEKLLDRGKNKSQ